MGGRDCVRDVIALRAVAREEGGREHLRGVVALRDAEREVSGWDCVRDVVALRRTGRAGGLLVGMRRSRRGCGVLRRPPTCL